MMIIFSRCSGQPLLLTNNSAVKNRLVSQKTPSEFSPTHPYLSDPEGAVSELGGDVSLPSSAFIAFRDWRAWAKLVLILTEEINSTFVPRDFVLYTISRSGTEVLRVTSKSHPPSEPKNQLSRQGRVLTTCWVHWCARGKWRDLDPELVARNRGRTSGHTHGKNTGFTIFLEKLFCLWQLFWIFLPAKPYSWRK